MCHAESSRPPLPAESAVPIRSQRRTLTSEDGTELLAHEAVPADVRTEAGVVVLPDVRGLHPYYADLAERFAGAGRAAVAIDYFGRTAGVGARGDDFDWQTHREQLTPAQVALDAAAAVRHLRDELQVPTVFTVGFCFGGSQSWRLAAADLPLQGVIGFYGRPSLVSDVIPQMRRPMLLLVAGADRATPLAEFYSLRDQLAAAQVDFEMQVYDGAPHSFFDRSYAEWQEACADAWQRVLSFIDRHTSPRS